MTELLEKAFDLAADSTKQLITLATGVAALTITFLKDVLLGTVPADARTALHVAWVLYFVSIIFGVFALLALTGTVGTRNRTKREPPSIYEHQVTVPSIIQVVTFLAAIVLTVVFAIIAL